MSASDTYVYDLSTQTEGDNHIFMNKSWLSVIDLNSTNYSSNICTIQTDVLANSSRYVNMYEATLLIPLSIFLTQQAGTQTTFTPQTVGCDYALGMKNSLLTLIANISTQLNGVTLTQQIPLCSLWNCFKLLSTMNFTDVCTWASIGFYPDSFTSVNYYSAPGPGGMATCNNSNYITPLVMGSATGVVAGTNGQCNIGFLNRQLYYAYRSTNTTLAPLTTCNTIYKSYIPAPTAPNGGFCGSWSQYIVGQIRMRDLHDLFAQMPLLKGSFLRIQLGLNNTSFQFSTQQATTADGSTTSMYCTAVNTSLGGVNPLMVASTATNNGGASLIYGAVAAAAAAATPYMASIQVGANCLYSTQVQAAGALGTTGNPMLKSVTLTAPAYVFSPSIESMYLSAGQKKVSYNELFQWTYYNLGANGSVNALISSGIQAVQEIVIFPLISTATNNINGNGGATLNLPQYQSPFDPCGGGTVGPLAQLSQVQIVVAGQNALMKNEQYIYEAFYQQYLGQAGQINGGLSDGLNAGLYSELDFFYSPCYYVNLSRGLASDDLVLKSISIQAQNLSPNSLDLVCFITYKKDFTVDLRTGALV